MKSLAESGNGANTLVGALWASRCVGGSMLDVLVGYAPNSLFSIPGLAFPSSSILDDRSAMFFIIWGFSSSWVGPTSFH